ncbi:Aspartate aminotransferase [hydrothermal vent metagenome]|uniref:Aspartate aminotransferase n=1 Tax=hydrothermal vent metagenome TaxID=652676 RepID=A0A3B1DZK9_9ZZZZ
MKLSATVAQLKPSATIAAAAKAKELKSTGVTVYEFTLGEPDFNTPAHICDAAKVAMDSGQTHYTPAAGTPALKNAICAAYKRDHGLEYQPNEIVVSNGAKHSIHNLLTALCDPGDEVIIPTPYWVSYSALVDIAGGTPVMVETSEESGFRMNAEQFAAAITPKTKLLMLNNPCNPTGAAYDIETLEAIAKVAVEKDVMVMSDEIYEKLIYEGSHFKSFSTFGKDVREKTIIVNGVSKAYAMTGWRIGWTMAPAELTAAMTKLQSQETSNPCSVSQAAAIAALEGPQECVSDMLIQFAQRRKYVLERFANIANVTYATPGGAFYLFFNVSHYFGKTLGGGKVVETSTDFCTALLEEAHVGLVTGDAFGAPGYVRLSFATNMEVIEEGINRLEKFLMP